MCDSSQTSGIRRRTLPERPLITEVLDSVVLLASFESVEHARYVDGSSVYTEASSRALFGRLYKVAGLRDSRSSRNVLNNVLSTHGDLSRVSAHFQNRSHRCDASRPHGSKSRPNLSTNEHPSPSTYNLPNHPRNPQPPRPYTLSTPIHIPPSLPQPPTPTHKSHPPGTPSPPTPPPSQTPSSPHPPPPEILPPPSS